MLRTSNKDLSTYTIFVNLILSLHFFRTVTGETEVFYFASVLGLLLALYTILMKNAKVPTVYALTILFCPLILLHSIPSNGLLNAFGNVVYFIMPIGLGYCVAISKINIKYLDFLYFGLSAYIIFQILITNMSPDSLFANSRNYIFVNLFSILILRFIIEQRVISHVSFIDVIRSFVLLVCSTLAIGSSGIILSVIIFTYFLFSYALTNRKSGAFLFATIIIAGSMYNTHLINYINDYSVELLIKLDFTRIVANDIRWKILNNYYETINSVNFFTGQNFETTFLRISNVHNSFILGQMRYGLFFFIIFVFILFSILRYIRRISSFLMLIFLIRCFADTIIFSGNSFDFLLYAYLFCLKYDAKSRQKTLYLRIN